MNAKRIGQRADYILTMNGNLERNAEGVAVISNYVKARDAHEQLQSGWAGAYVAGLFREYPWLESMTIELKVSGEYDDNGGTYRSISASIENVTRREDVHPPEDAVVDGEFDPEIGATLIEAYFDDDGADLYDSFHPDCDDNEDLALNVNRQAVAPLLEGEEVSGRDAFMRLFPTYVPTSDEPREPSRDDVVRPQEVFVLMEDGEVGTISSVYRTRAAAEQALRDALAQYETGGEPVFTEAEIDREVQALSDAAARNEYITVDVLDRSSLWIDVCEVKE